MVNKSAFTLLELVFAIVIIGITIVTLPLMTQATSKGIQNNLVQEAVFAGAAELAQIQTYRWDENSLNPALSNSIARVININDCDSHTKLRIGHINQPYHRRCLNDLSIKPSTPLGSDANDLDDIDDNIQINTSLFSGSISAHGYKDNYKSSIDVSYATFGDIDANSKNIKKITVHITDSQGRLLTSLSTYSANIGEIDYFKRSF